MKFVVLCGPQAVGKMTVGQELSKLTGLKLFHNHMTIDLVSPFFDYGTAEGKRLVSLFRHELFDAVAKSDGEGMIFTYVWAFDMEEDWEYITGVASLFEAQGGTTYYVELEADLSERLVRNQTENRLLHKPTKRDLDWSENELKTTAVKYRLNSYLGEITFPNYLRINNMKLTAGEVAKQIRDYFDL